MKLHKEALWRFVSAFGFVRVAFSTHRCKIHFRNFHYLRFSFRKVKVLIFFFIIKRQKKHLRQKIEQMFFLYITFLSLNCQWKLIPKTVHQKIFILSIRMFKKRFFPCNNAVFVVE